MAGASASWGEPLDPVTRQPASAQSTGIPERWTEEFLKMPENVNKTAVDASRSFLILPRDQQLAWKNLPPRSADDGWQVGPSEPSEPGFLGTVKRLSRGLPDIDPINVATRAGRALAQPLTTLFSEPTQYTKGEPLPNNTGPATGDPRADRALMSVKQSADITAPIGLAVPPFASAPARVAAQGAASAAEGALRGEYSPAELLKNFGVGAALTGIFETALAPFRYMRYGKAADLAKQNIEAGSAAHEAALNQHAEDAATSIADDFKSLVPAWQDFKSGTKGLLEMVYGRGQQALSEGFDGAMRDVAERAAGKTIAIDPRDALAFRIPIQQPQIPPEIRARLGLRPGESAPYLNPAGGGAAPEGKVLVDAADAAQAAQGAWRKNPGAYGRVVGALDDAGIGDPAARAAYKAGMGLINFVDKSKALQGEVFRPERVIDSLTDLKTLDQLRRRGLGDINTGPMQAARGAPAPYQPPTLEDLGFRTSRFAPGVMGGIAGKVAGAAAGGAVGHPYIGASVGGTAGAGIGAGLGPVYTKAPVGSFEQWLLTQPPSVISSMARQSIDPLTTLQNLGNWIQNRP